MIKDRGVFIKLLLAGALAGAVNGLLGAGGGIIVVIAASRLIPESKNDKNSAFATALCVMLPISALSVFLYGRAGHLSMQGFGIFIIPAVIGGAVGGILLGRLKTDFLKRLFAALVVISGILLIVR